MSLMDLNMLGILVEDLNKEIAYQVSGAMEVPMENVARALRLNSDGENHQIWFYGLEIWSSELEKNLEQLTPEQEMELNTRDNFEKHLRNLIMDQVKGLSAIDV